MKKIVCILMPIFFATAIPLLSIAQTSDSLLARKFITLNTSGKFDEARSMFAPALQNQITPEMLKQIWSSLEQRYGPYNTISSIKQTKQDSFQVFFPVCDFEKARITLSIVFGPSHSIWGFHNTNVSEKKPAPMPDDASSDTSIQVDGGKLYGSILKPAVSGKVPVVLIIAGSGPTDRNGNAFPVLEGNSYRMLAESLEKHGIASLRYDKRYVGKSTGFSAPKDSLRFGDYVNDAIAWTRFLQSDGEFSKVIIAGHSEGSLIGILAAEKAHADAFISLDGAGEPIGKIIAWQLAQQPIPEQDRIKTIIDSIGKGYLVKDIPRDLQTIFNPSVQPYLTSWMQYDPAKEIAKLKMPALIVNGTTDIQVTERQAELLHAAKPDAKLAIIPGMNHVLKDAPADRAENIATYGKADLPLNAELVQQVVSFIHSLPSHNHS